jgi:hypothetical protein
MTSKRARCPRTRLHVLTAVCIACCKCRLLHELVARAPLPMRTGSSPLLSSPLLSSALLCSPLLSTSQPATPACEHVYDDDSSFLSIQDLVYQVSMYPLLSYCEYIDTRD